ncbi:Sensors of blue-light using FAD [Brevundimonas sp. SH203]|uniref:BLUF domain-containing protein n=1 Tax=Brevundimonas sp. SH203 TaxID=345167 RepID=UPI0009D38BB4|nr:BLUF domain-containing protein [Brevundimonas sp. SH203]GAW41967.1 Sensors of blue-light using FAD [Brevundimonas sp. SH203]
MPLFRIVYVSRAAGTAASGLMPLVDIIGVSDQNNRRDQLTGVLLRHDGRFFQVLEGARVDLDRTLARVRSDGRHADMKVLSDHAVEARMFPDWAMAQVEATPDVVRLLGAGVNRDAIQADLDRMLIDLSPTVAGAV